MVGLADAVERLVNLAITIASARTPVTAAQIRAQVAGYPPGQDDAAFQRMFERDKEDLRAAGLILAVDRSGGVESYLLDESATFAAPLALSAEEATLIRAAGAAMLSDLSFPHATDLRLALAKLAAVVEDAPVPLTGPAPVCATTADEDPDAQALAAGTLIDAVRSRKTVTFGYRSPGSGDRTRSADPYGLFARDGRWYLVARDHEADDVRVFAVVRMSGLTVNAQRPKEPDFERPKGFDVAAWMLHPFQFGPVRTEATLRLTGAAAWRADALTRGQGRRVVEGDGSVRWTVEVADTAALARWAVENGPGIAISAPEEASHALADGLAKVVAAHAG